LKRQDRKAGNRGFSLIELIISMAMLAIIAIPLLGYFTSSAAYNARAKNRQNAVALSQSIIEVCRDKSVEELARSFHAADAEFYAKFNLVPMDKIEGDRSRIAEVDASGNVITDPDAISYDAGRGVFRNSLDGILRYAIRNIKENGNSYDALITVDTNTGAGATYHAVNGMALYQIKAIQSPDNIVAAETTQNDRVVISMRDLNRDYCDRKNLAHQGEAGWSYLLPKGEAEVENALVRDIYIEIDPYGSSTSKAKVKIYYKYYCPGIDGCPQDSANALEVDPPLYQETVSLEDMKNIYVFFQRNKDVEQVMLDIDSVAALNFRQGIKLYLLCQAADASAATAPPYTASINPAGNSYDKLEAVYSNADSILKNNMAPAERVSAEYIGKEPKLRMADITVDIYEAGELMVQEHLYASMHSTHWE